MTDSRGSVLQRIASSLVSQPRVYKFVQALAGQPRIAARVREVFSANPTDGRVLDVGSSEGSFAERLNLDLLFVDVDWKPLVSLRRRRPGSRAAAASATDLPFADRAFDVTLCVAVSHHLDDAQLEAAIRELARVTRGHLVFLDAIRNERRALSRWLWRFDRGRYPRTRAELEAALGRGFHLRRSDAFAVRHQYVIWVAAPR